MMFLQMLLYPLVSLFYFTIAFLIVGGTDSVTDAFATHFGVFALFILLPCAMSMGVVGAIHLAILHLQVGKQKDVISDLSIKIGLVFGAIILLWFCHNRVGLLLFGIPALLTTSTCGLAFSRIVRPVEYK